MPPAGFKPAIPAGEWPQTHILGRTATGNSYYSHWYEEKNEF